MLHFEEEQSLEEAIFTLTKAKTLDTLDRFMRIWANIHGQENVILMSAVTVALIRDLIEAMDFNDDVVVNRMLGMFKEKAALSQREPGAVTLNELLGEGDKGDN